MSEYLMMTYKCLVFYGILIVFLRIMGKREVGELSIFDVVVFFVISELFSISINNPESSILKSLIPISVIVFLQILLSYIVLKSKKIREIIDGKSVFIIKNGVLQQENMRKLRYNLDDLFCQLRNSGYDSISEIEYAILEINGDLSIIRKDECKTSFPFLLISDGKIVKDSIKQVNINEEMLYEMIREQGYEKVEDIFLALLEKERLLIVRKE